MISIFRCRAFRFVLVALVLLLAGAVGACVPKVVTPTAPVQFPTIVSDVPSATALPPTHVPTLTLTPFVTKTATKTIPTETAIPTDAPTAAPVATIAPPSEPPPMTLPVSGAALSQNPMLDSVLQLIVILIGAFVTGGAMSFILEKIIPGWHEWKPASPELKAGITLVLSAAAVAALTALQTDIVPAYFEVLPNSVQIFIGTMAAFFVSQVTHIFDKRT